MSAWEPGIYCGERIDRVAFPLGGMGAGMVCLEGTGALSHFSLRHRPDVFNEPQVFAAVCVTQDSPQRPSVTTARVLEGPVPSWKLFGPAGTGSGAPGKTYGLPRFSDVSFSARFPFGTVQLADSQVPLGVELTGWSPFEAGDADNASLPVAGLEYRFINRGPSRMEAVFSFNARNFMATGDAGQEVLPAPGGFILNQRPLERPHDAGAFCISVDEPAVRVNHAWFRGGWWDSLTMVWRDVAEGACYDRPPAGTDNPAPGGSLFVPFVLEPAQEKSVAVQLAWYVPHSDLRAGPEPDPRPPEPAPTYKPWYAGRFRDIGEVAAYWRANYQELRTASKRFSDCFHDTTLPPEIVEAVAANLAILKSPSVLRQADGRLWAWEGCRDDAGCCPGTCTHVWNYAQAIPHLFPGLERGLRETEFQVIQNEEGHQNFRVALPIAPSRHDFHAAADGQLGGLMKLHRDWRISGDTEWLRRMWPRARTALDYCITTWDPDREGVLEEPHHNTYDIEFWGPDGMCTSIYLGALASAVCMGRAVGEDVAEYEALLGRGRRAMETELWDGEYFIQKVKWQGLKAGDPTRVQSFQSGYSPEALELLQKEGPKYQYGIGCLSDGVLGAWLAAVCGVGSILDEELVTTHLRSVHKYNLQRDLSRHANPQRPSYAAGREGGLLLCTWPKGGEPSLPFIYSNEVWTGIEYHVASHLMMQGLVDEGLEIVRTCRQRYDGRVRNPFNEYECGHWYARAMSSYGLLQGLTGAQYDAVERVLYLRPSIKGDFRSFLATAEGYGTVGVKNAQPFIEVKAGAIELSRIDYT